MSETRELRSISCAKCSICLVVADETLKRKCAGCGHLNSVPRSLIEDSDFLRRLSFDADEEAKMGLARVVAGTYSPPEFPRWVLVVVALIGMGIGGYSAINDGLVSILGWTLAGGAFCVVVVGWTIQWIQATTASTFLTRIQTYVQEEVPRACPSCAIDIDAAATGTFPCTKCDSELISSSTLIGLPGMSRQEGWEKQATAALKGVDWLEGMPLTKSEILWVVLTIVVVLGIFAWVRLDLEHLIFPHLYR